MLNQQQGQLDDARNCYEQALVIRREISDHDGIGATLSSLGSLHSEQGQMQQAEALQLEALEIGRGLGLRSLEGEVLTELGSTYRKQGRLDESLTMLNAARNVLAATGNVIYLCITHCYLAQLAASRGEPAAAQESLAAARQIAAQMGAGESSELHRYLQLTEEAVAHHEKQLVSSGH
jgi:tetratricopeptide (TPR) repeat protein